ncbi:periplasmic heavy metal sensor [Caulobacter sp. ErkDOM-E]|uniref:periplasmic heavy metal sensor n=1 Tax=Caulobacter sp. ErkDOM-E TaxID=3402778 RepID=UPI003AF81462
MTVSRSLLIGLIISAALNVFLVGGVVGVLWVRQAPSDPMGQPSRAAALTSTTPATSTVAMDDVAQAPLQPRPAPSQSPQPPAAVAVPPGEAPARPQLWTAGERLSQESRQTLRRTLREANQRNQPIIRQARAERQAALQAFKAMPYDPALAGQHLAAARVLDGQARTNVEGALATFAASLSVDERAALAEGLQRVYAPRARTEVTR